MEPLTFGMLREINLRRQTAWHMHGIDSWSMSDWAVATGGELGEAMNVIKKLNRARDGISGNTKPVEALREQLANELADTMIYLDLLAARCGIDLGVATAKKFNKTSAIIGFEEWLPEEG
jgi:NTP pyrophosphatase (non-canonical NTP hydrolase)